MNLDAHDLPVQSDGNNEDQLQRVGMIVTGSKLNPMLGPFSVAPSVASACYVNLISRLGLQPKVGLFSRSVGSPTNNVSADQLISALCGLILTAETEAAWAMLGRMMLRAGFAQNTRDGLSASAAWKIPDSMLFRAMPLFVRLLPYALSFPLSLFFDLYLVIMAISAVYTGKQSPNNVDNNDTFMTFAVCTKVKPSPWSALSNWILRKFLPWNYGCTNALTQQQITQAAGLWGPATGLYRDTNKSAYGSLRWYHRAEAGGNPEIADLWAPICKDLWE